jgi:hypothetical protein
MTELERMISEKGVSVVIDELADVLMKKLKTPALWNSGDSFER